MFAIRRPGNVSQCYLIGCILALFIQTGTSFGQRLEQFGSETGKRNMGERVNRIPYEKVISYFDYIKDKPDSSTQTKSIRQLDLYFFLEDTLIELGLRVLSPVPELVTPRKGDIATNEFFENTNRSYSGFDPKVKLSRAKGSFKKEDLGSKKFSPSWIVLAENDNQEEMFRKEYSLLRIVSNATGIVLYPGLYCISITGEEKKDLQGSFLLQAGFNPSQGNLRLVNSWRTLIPE